MHSYLDHRYMYHVGFRPLGPCPGGGGLVFKIVFKIEDINTFLLLIFVLFFFVLFWNGILFSFSI